ncbi:MAG: hypothetical protein R3Y09_13300, partial [Clostridia bacterium]
MRDWRLTSFKGIKVYNKSLINSRLTSFEYESPDVFYKKELENAQIEQILNIFNQMIELKNQNETNFSFYTSQIEYYLLTMSHQASLTALYEEVLKSINQQNFNKQSENYVTLVDKIENYRQQIFQSTKNSINTSKNNQNITNKADFNINIVKNSFLNRFNSLDDSSKSEFLAQYDLNLNEIHMLKNTSKDEWIKFVKKISGNTHNFQQKNDFVQGENIYFDEKLNRKSENKIENNSTKKYENILNFIENQNLNTWEILKNEYVDFKQKQDKFESNIEKINNFTQNSNFENIQEVNQAIIDIRTNFISSIDVSKINLEQKDTLEKFEKTINNAEILLLSKEIIENISNSNNSIYENSQVGYEYEEKELNIRNISNFISDSSAFYNQINQQKVYELANKILFLRESNMKNSELKSIDNTTNELYLFAEKILENYETSVIDSGVNSAKYEFVESKIFTSGIYELAEKVIENRSNFNYERENSLYSYENKTNELPTIELYELAEKVLETREQTYFDAEKISESYNFIEREKLTNELYELAEKVVENSNNVNYERENNLYSYENKTNEVATTELYELAEKVLETREQTYFDAEKNSESYNFIEREKLTNELYELAEKVVENRSN